MINTVKNINMGSGAGATPSVLLVEKTHAELRALQLASGLEAGRKYKLTDFITKHNVMNGNNILPEVLTAEYGEPLILTASSQTAFYERVESVYGIDVIHYDINDDKCEDGITPRPGSITYRRNINGVETYYDFRSVRFRRWRVNTSVIPTWVSGGTYNQDDFVIHNSILYICLMNVTGEVTVPASAGKNYTPICYVGALTATKTPYISAYNTTMIIGSAYDVFKNIPIDSTQYMDYYTCSGIQYASESSDVMMDIKIEKFVVMGAKRLNNIVLLDNLSYTTFGNTFGVSCHAMTFIKNTFNNTFGSGCYNFLCSTNFRGNMVKQGYNNTFFADTSDNLFNGIYNCIFGSCTCNQFNSNNIGHAIMTGIRDCVINAHITHWVIGSWLKYLTVEAGCELLEGTIYMYQPPITAFVYTAVSKRMILDTGGFVKMQYLNADGTFALIDPLT